MSVVVHHPTDSPGTTLLKHEQELMIAHPYLSPGHVRQLVKEQHPDLWALHHQGFNSAAEAEPTVDPGEIINRRAYALQQTNVARSFAEAVEIAMRQLPEAAEAYNSGLRMPAASACANAEPAPPTRTSNDPGTELMRLVQERISANPTVSIAEAQKFVLDQIPTSPVTTARRRRCR